ncbi:endoplasmic reticulum metallopeptidase 1-like [Drosophila novamexicana]|uniref:endoplasmic reticulum metallopeptidase 1-like n=1 Tax=Drosophila novamexicana TaxID=47314 RepID=UPI0011E5AFB0|nr:endoplasmic reticulum metallopeptidase 1-like [Drosophila novamexicana]
MSQKEKEDNSAAILDVALVSILKGPKNLRAKLPWYYAPAFLLFWLALFFAVVIPLFNRLPDSVTIAEESLKPGEFVAERAQQLLYSFDSIGPKVVGSVANEKLTVDFLLGEVENVRTAMRSDLYELEVDVQQSSGAYMHWNMVNMYQAVQNVVVKLSTRSSTSESYLLLNSHFDSKPSSPGTGDDGTMVIVMLEVLRQMAISDRPFEHPIVFLFNGAEENPLQASHGFITQHKWAKNCKALINLEVAGSGGRDLLFQGGPNHPWLMRYYRHHAKHPFATTMAEEIFQAGILPSDTDFRIFRDYGQVPGLDMAQINNGYVYHTIFDNYAAVPRDSLQNTGENVLPLVRAFANASEMHDTEAHSEGHAVFFDFLGLFFVFYTETIGIVLNCCIAAVSLLLVCVSLWRMARVSEQSLCQVALWFAIILGLHVLGVVLSLGLPLLMAVMFDAGDRSLTYFTNTWLMIGLYICPAIIGLSLPTTLYYSFRKNLKINHAYHLHMSLHAHCVVLAVIAITLTAISLRTPYLCMISTLFYSAALLVNLLSTLHDRSYYWVLITQIFQLMPFFYFCYLFYMFLIVFIPMMGRNGSSINPDLLVALLCTIGTFFAMGFVSPLINMFRWSRFIMLTLGIVTFIFSMIAVSDVGFPYRARTSVMRVNFLHVRRIFYEYDGSVSLSDSGYYFDFQDRRLAYPLEETSVNLTGLSSIEQHCDTELMCGVPCFNHRWCKARTSGHWLAREQEVAIPGNSSLVLLGKTIMSSGTTVRYEFELSGPPHMGLFIQPLEGVTVEDWSFIRTALDEPENYKLPYQIFFSYGKDNSPLKFHIDFAKPAGNFDVPIFEMGVAWHYVSYDFERDSPGLQFIADFPDFVHVMEWPTLYKRYIL